MVRKSKERYDWLGNGFYVWENNYERALQWAHDKKKRGGITDPSVVGVIYQLDYCLDFTDSQFTDILPEYYERMKEDLSNAGQPLPQNRDLDHDKYKDLILRELDCAVIEYMHQKIEEEIKGNPTSQLQPFDTARGIFTEGGSAFEGGAIQKKSHIQVCIRNLNCIKGFFIPRKEANWP